MTRHLPIGDLAPGERKLMFADGRCVVVFNIGGTIRAIDDSCPHNGASLASGELDGPVLRCPAHGLRFDLTTGCPPAGGGLCLTSFPVEEVGDKMVVVLDCSAAKTPLP